MNQEQVTINGIKLWVEYEYVKGEPPIHGWKHNYPGSPSEIIIHEIYVDGTHWDISSITSISEDEQIEQQLLKLHEG